MASNVPLSGLPPANVTVYEPEADMLSAYVSKRTSKSWLVRHGGVPPGHAVMTPAGLADVETITAPAVGGSVLVGVAFRGVGSSFKAVVETHGNDIGNLLAALRSLDRAFLTQLVAVVAAFCLGIVGAILAAAVRS